MRSRPNTDHRNGGRSRRTPSNGNSSTRPAREGAGTNPDPTGHRTTTGRGRGRGAPPPRSGTQNTPARAGEGGRPSGGGRGEPPADRAGAAGRPRESRDAQAQGGSASRDGGGAAVFLRWISRREDPSLWPRRARRIAQRSGGIWGHRTGVRFSVRQPGILDRVSNRPGKLCRVSQTC